MKESAATAARKVIKSQIVGERRKKAVEKNQEETEKARARSLKAFATIARRLATRQPIAGPAKRLARAKAERKEKAKAEKVKASVLVTWKNGQRMSGQQMKPQRSVAWNVQKSRLT